MAGPDPIPAAAPAPPRPEAELPTKAPDTGLLPPDKTVRIEAGGSVLVPTPGTDSGWQTSFSIQGGKSRIDRDNVYGAKFDFVQGSGKQGDGSHPGYDIYSLQFVMSQIDYSFRSDRIYKPYIFSREEKLKRTYTFSGTQSGIGYAYIGFHNDPWSGGGKTYERSGGPWHAIAFTDTMTIWGGGYCSDVGCIEGGLYFGQDTIYPIVSLAERGMQAFSPNRIRLGLQASGSFGGNNSELGQDAPFGTHEKVRLYFGEGKHLIQTPLNYKLFSQPLNIGTAEAEKTGFTSTGASQDTELLIPLYMVQSVMGGLAMAGWVNSIHDAYKGDPTTAIIGLVSRGGAAAAWGIWGAIDGGAGRNFLISESARDLQMVTGGILSITGWDVRAQLAIRMAISKALLFAGLKEPGLMSAGLDGEIMNTMFPEPANAGFGNAGIVENTEVILRPFNWFMHGEGFATASVGIRRYIQTGSPNTRVALETEIETHLLYPVNLGRRFSNMKEDGTPYEGIDHNTIRTHVELIQKLGGPINLIVGAHTLLDFLGNKPGGGGSLALQGVIPAGDYTVNLEVGILEEKAVDRPARGMLRSGLSLRW